MSLRETALLTGMVVTVIPVAAAYLRHRSGLALGATVLAALSMSALLAIVWRLIRLGPATDVKLWVYLLVAGGVPMLLSGYFLSAVLGRESPGEALKSVIRTFVAILGGGILALVFLQRGAFVVGYQWKAGSGTVLLGPLGKAYLSYLLVGMVFVGYNLESTYRLADGAGRERLRPVVLGLFGVLGFYTYVLTTGLLYSAVEIDNIVASAVPLLVASLLVSYGFLKGSLADTAVPVSRTVVYSSFTAFAAALYVLAMGMAAQLASFTRWSPGQVVTVSFVFLVVLAAATMVFSNRIQRSVRRFIDRNFYVNRYDYRTQWSRVTRTLEPSQGPEGVARAAEAMFKDVFLADRVTVTMRDRNGHGFRPFVGKGKGDPEAVLLDGSPLIQRLLGERHSLLLERQPDDLDYVPIYVENREWLEHTASQVVAPLLVGQELRGIVGLERSHPDDRFSFEDLDLLDCMAAQVGAVMRAVELAQELAEAREMELLSQWSNLILHDLKNYLSPLQLIVQNMRVHMGNPEFQKEAVEDLAAVAGQMERLIKRLSELRDGARITKGTVDLNELAGRTITDLQLYRRSSLTVKMELTADEPVRGDAGMLRRVAENLVQNAVEAMHGNGCLTVRTEVRPDLGNGVPKVVLSVTDTGPGIDEVFVRDRLFRPFASTKKKGLGLGLYQCRTIVEAHGGEIFVESRLGEGTTFRVALMAARRVETRRLVGAPERPRSAPGVRTS